MKANRHRNKQILICCNGRLKKRAKIERQVWQSITSIYKYEYKYKQYIKTQIQIQINKY